MERSTWVSAAQFTTAWGLYVRNNSATAVRSAISVWEKVTRGLVEDVFKIVQTAGVRQLINDNERGRCFSQG